MDLTKNVLPGTAQNRVNDFVFRECSKDAMLWNGYRNATYSHRGKELLVVRLRDRLVSIAWQQITCTEPWPAQLLEGDSDSVARGVQSTLESCVCAVLRKLKEEIEASRHGQGGAPRICLLTATFLDLEQDPSFIAGVSISFYGAWYWPKCETNRRISR